MTRSPKRDLKNYVSLYALSEKDKYLEKCLKLLEEKDSPTLLIVFRKSAQTDF
jgi:hypothetical protein